MGVLECVMTDTLCSVPAPWPGNLLRAASELNRNGLCPGKQQYDTTQFLKGERAIPASVSFGMAQYQRRESKSLWPGLWHCVKWPEDIDSWASHCRGSGKLDIEVVAAALSPETFLLLTLSVSFGMAQYLDCKSLWPGLWHCVKWPEDIASWALSLGIASGKLDIEVVAAALSPETFLSCLLAQCPVTLAQGNTGVL